jgi:magnesium-protoporphyrin IX monomethyl ester (oxidative) cyclase
MGKKITLVSSPVYSQGVLSFLPHNVGLGYVAACLEAQGHRVQVIDAVAEGFDTSVAVWSWGRELLRTGLPYAEIIRRIEPDTQLIGLSVPFTMYADIAQELVSVIKGAFPAIPLVMGGVYPSTLPEHALSQDVDFVVQREGEIPMVRLADGDDPGDIKGLAFRQDGRLVDNGPADSIKELDEIPFPARHLFPIDKHLARSPRGVGGGRALSMVTSRSCPYKCTFCSIHAVAGRHWRARSPRNVLEEIEHLVRSYGVEHIQFEDDNLTLRKGRAVAIFEGMVRLKRDLKAALSWSCGNGLRVDTLDRDLLELIAASGCQQLSFAVESGDPNMLELIDKKFDSLEKIVEVAAICHELGLPTQAFMIIGLPGETQESFRMSLRFFRRLRKNGVSHVAIHLGKAYPQTPLFDQCLAQGYLVSTELTHTRNLEGGPFRERRYVGIVTPHFSADEVLRRRDEAHRVLNPRQYYREKYASVERLERRARSLLPAAVSKRARGLLRARHKTTNSFS